MPEGEGKPPKLGDAISGNPHFFYFGEKLGMMRQFALFYLVVALILLVAAMPPVAGIILSAIAGAVCAGLQLLIVRSGKRGLFMLPFVLLVLGMALAVFFRIGPFNAGNLQVASFSLLAVSIQRAICGYSQAWALGGASFSLQGKKD